MPKEKSVKMFHDGLDGTKNVHPLAKSYPSKSDTPVFGKQVWNQITDKLEQLSPQKQC